MTTENTALADGTAGTPAAGTGTPAAGSPPATSATSTTTDPNAAPANGTPAAGKEGADTSNTADTQVPEKYEFKAPEGIDLEQTAVGEFSALAKDLKLSQADAQKVADVAVKWQQRQLEGHVATVAGWVDQSKTDKEFGGDAFDANLGIARKAIETFGTPALKEVLDASGFGNHPEVIRAFFKAGKAISEGKFIGSGGRTAIPETNHAQRLYPGMNP